MTAVHPEAARAFLEGMKDSARDLGDVTYPVSRTVTLRCSWKPNMSYGRYHEPTRECEVFEWWWAVWTLDDALNAPEHVLPRNKGWTGLPCEDYALRLLAGEPWDDVKASLEAQGREMAVRFGGEA